MWTLVKGIAAGIWGYVAAVVAAIAAVFTAWQVAKKSGKDELRADQAKKELQDVKKARKVAKSVAVANPDDVRKRLRKFRRD